MEEKKIIKDGQEIIRVEGLEKSFGKLHVLKGI
ncbi:MAG TPA: ABC transporter ATP-binding protein, partial [Candidatus Avilachnospira avistercoris]|nr:ABC transporter ATP-binding protein [Candidatus Avilachnospira avistercoris]